MLKHFKQLFIFQIMNDTICEDISMQMPRLVVSACVISYSSN